MTAKERYIESAKANGWVVTVENIDTVWAARENRQDGYPHRLTITFDELKSRDGFVWNDYGDGSERFKVGLRNQMDVLTNIGNPLRYKTFYEAYTRRFKGTRKSEKEMGVITGYSERQIRKARICGFADDIFMDRLCVLLLGEHPASLYGYESWVSGIDISEQV